MLDVVARMDRDCQTTAGWLMAMTEAVQYRGPRGNVCERIGGRGNAELLPSERAEHARRALCKMWARVPAELAQVCEYRIVFRESESAVGIRLGLSRGQVSRRFVRGLQAVGRILRGRRS